MKREIERKRKQLTKAEKISIGVGDSRLTKLLKEEINLLLDKEAIMWQ